MIEWRSHVFNSRLFEAATHSDAAWGAFRVPRTTHELVWSEKTAPQKTVPGWPRAQLRLFRDEARALVGEDGAAVEAATLVEPIAAAENGGALHS